MAKSSASAVQPVAAAPPGLCLDFANTRYWRGTPKPAETIAAPQNLLDWLKSSGGGDRRAAEVLQAEWKSSPESGGKAFAAAIELREAMFRIFAASVHGNAPGPSDLDRLNAVLAEAPPRRKLARAKQGFAWDVGGAPLARLLAPVLWSAGDLLAGTGLARVRQCANPDCQWLFLDDSKSGTRRWCAMSACGNRAKAHRHYLKCKRG